MKNNILFVLPFLPYPLKSGGHQAIFNGIKALAEDFNIFITYDKMWYERNSKLHTKLKKELGGSVTILPYKIPFALKYPPPFAEKFVISIWKLIERFKGNRTKENFSNYDLNFLDPPKNKTDFINDIIKRHNISIVQCEMLENIRIGEALPASVKKIFVHHEIGFTRKEREQVSDYNSIQINNESLITLKKQEIFYLNKFDKIITLSSIDSQKLINAGLSSSISTSFAVINNDNKSSLTKDYNPNILTFIGPSIHKPNVDGIHWFLRNCWPTLKKKSPNMQLKIIGNWDNDNKTDILSNYKDVVFTGYVNNLSDHLPGTIMIVPITIGSGIRMKILEASSYNIPIITTSIGVEGIPVNDKKECLKANTPDDFINCILDLQNIKIGTALATNLKKLVEKDFSFDRFKKNRLQIYKDL